MAIIKVKTGGITADAVTDALIADDVVGTEHLTANEVDTTALGADAVTGAQLADNAVNSEHYTDGSIDTAHIADAQVTAAKLASGVGGKILQVKHNMISSSFLVSGNGTTQVIWTGDTLTLGNSSNKVLVLGSFSVGGDRGGSIALQFSVDGGSNYSDITTADMNTVDSNLDGKSVLGFHNNLSANANNSFQSSFNYLHAPSNTSAKYRLVAAGTGSSYAISINRRDADDGYGGLSWVTQMEVSA